MEGVPHATRRKNEGNNLGRKQNSVKGGGHLLGKGDGGSGRKSARKKYKAARVGSRLEELTFGTFNVRTAAVNGVNGIGHIGTLLRTCAGKGCDVIGLQVTIIKGTELPKFRQLDTAPFSGGDYDMVKSRKEQHGVGLVIREGTVSLKRLARMASQSSASAHVS